MKLIAGVPAAEYHRQYHQRRYGTKLQMLMTYLGGKCVRCESEKDLEFHHLDPRTKEFSITKRWNRPLEELKPELDKCILLCKDHHKEVTEEHDHLSSRRDRGYSCGCGREYDDRLRYAGHRRWCRA